MIGRPRLEVEIPQTFRGPRVLTLPQLMGRLACSRATVFRRLREHGYYSSYNHAGRFLTIPEVAEFDARGLWFWKAARFSRHGSLRDTVRYFIEQSESGIASPELAAVLGVRVQNPLRQLVRDHKTHRERLGPTFVYLSERAAVRRRQGRRRRAILKERQKAVPTSRQIIATLLELIREPQATRERIVLRCRRAGVPVPRDVVEAIFERYDLDKKRAP